MYGLIIQNQIIGVFLLLCKLLPTSHLPPRRYVFLSSQTLLRQLALDVAHLFLLGDVLETVNQLSRNKKPDYDNVNSSKQIKTTIKQSRTNANNIKG